MRLRSNDDLSLEFATPIVARPRLESFFSFSSAARVVLLLAPAGYGKSLAVRSYLSDPSWIHYRVGGAGATFARFVRGFAQAVSAVASGAQASFPRAWERALQSGSPETVLARWMCEHLQHIDIDVVIDDLHDAGSDPRIAAFIAEFVRIRVDRRLAITARAPGLLPVPLWMATGVMDRPVDEHELAFDVAEARALAIACGCEPAGVLDLLEATGGCPVSVAYVIASQSRDGCENITAVRSFALLAERIFARRSPRERQFLLSASLLPTLSPDLLEACGWSDWRALFSGMATDVPFMCEFEMHAARRFHDRFAGYLAAQMSYEEPSMRIELAEHAVSALRSAGKHADALQAAVRQGLVTTIDQLLDKHGFHILGSGRVDEISEALSVIDASDISAGAVATAIRGYGEARLGRFDTSEAWFRLGLERAATDESRVAIALHYAGELMHQFRDDAFEVLEPYADSKTLPDGVLIDVRSSLGQAYMVADRVDDAGIRTAQALSMLRSDCPAALRARVLARAAYVAFESGDASTAREYAMLAAPIAIAEGLYDVATSAYTVLYTIAYEIDDNSVACLEFLACVHDCGIKSGTVRVDLYALVAMYELYSEAGNRERLAELDRAISAVDVNYATLSFLESFLPARALQAGWAGDFAYAQGVLAPTADRQATPLRKALRWSEVALYAAASGDRSAACAAAARAEQSIALGGARTTHLAFAMLNCALAFCVLNDFQAARAWAERAEDESIPGADRVRAFRAAVQCILDAPRNPLGFSGAMTLALGALDDSFFGGIALLIESLPLPNLATNLAERSRVPAPTVGAHLAAHRLDTLYLAAVESSAGEPLLFDWLHNAWEGDVGSRSIVRVLTHWTRPTAADSPRARTLAAKIREFTTSRSAAPAIVSRFGGGDDVDALIDMLFADLRHAAPLMAEHSQAVSAWCTRIARRLGLDEADIVYVTRCGLVHDIGKVKTPSSILEAPRGLDPAEWTIMRDHAAEGGRMAAGIGALVGLIPIIRGHHERLDGRGYPDGLRGGAIPLAARIVTVADCFNAMIGRRPYRPPMSPVEALEELDRNRRTQFDPEVVDAMIPIVMGLTPSTYVSQVT